MVSNIPALTAIIGESYGKMTGGDPLIIGLLGLGALLLFWAYMGAGFELAAVVFAPAIAIMAVTGYLPMWTLVLVAIAFGLGVAKLFRGSLQ